MSLQTQPFYEFGPFRLEPSERLLLRAGEHVSLPPKAFETLLLLVQNSGHVLTKDELMKTLWPDTFVEENNLTQHIAMLRRTLGEASTERAYIETVPRLGYRFVMPVREVSGNGGTEFLLQRHTRTRITFHEQEEEVTGTDTPEEAATKAKTLWKPGKRTASRKWMVATVVVGAAVLAALAAMYFRQPPVLTERDSILVADFTNSTGEPVFDGTLKQALAIKLEESPFLSVVPEQQVQETLRFMGHSPNEQLAGSIAHEVCQRLGIKALLAGSVERMGSHYVIALNALDCSSGDSLAREQVEADSREHVLQAMGKATSKLRGKLGESLASVQRFNAPVEQATTTSLQALQAFSVGDELRAQGREIDAVPYYKHATELDSNFAMAYARLAAVYANSGEFELAREAAKKAFALRERVSEREKFYISFHYYDKLGEGLGKQIETCELWRHVYPRDWYPNNALAALYTNGDHLEKAVQAGREAVRLNPGNFLPYDNLAYAYMCSNQLSQAKALSAKAIAARLDGPDSDVHATLYQIAFLENDAAAMLREVDLARGKPWEDSLLSVQYNAAATLGKLKEARELLRRNQRIQLQRGFAEGAALLQSAGAITEAEFGNRRVAHEQIKAALALAHSKAVEKNAALALARAGDTSGARILLDDLIKSQPGNTGELSLLRIRGAVEIMGNDPARAVELLRPTIFSPDFTTSYTLGVAYLRVGSYKEAAFEFQKILERRGAALLSPCPYYALAHLGLARAQAGTADFSKSRHSYEEFLALWENADPDIPVLQQARAEYAKLK
jgi:eukaryotic-like serine/threonine-protein kinase